MKFPARFPTALSLVLLLAIGSPSVIKAQSIIDLADDLLDLPYATLSEIFIDILPPLLGFPPGNINGSRSEFMPMEFNETQNQGIAFLTPEQILQRSGFNTTTYNVTSKDGYITQVIRVGSRMVDQTKLKPYPVVIFHGGLIDPRFYVIPSAIQHHPEKYPRTAADGPITSSNRSIPMTFVNNGYDVYLVGTRGCNNQNQGRTPGLPQFPSNDYWRFGLDEISINEIEAQIDLVRNVSGKQKVDMITYSLSTITSIQSFANNPSFPRNKVHNYVLFAPVVSNGQSSTIQKTFVNICLQTPVDLGIDIFTDLISSQPTREAFLALFEDKRIRYTVGKFVDTVIVGSSAQYLTFLEEATLPNVLRDTSFMELKQYCQIATAKQHQKFDFGAVGNRIAYGQSTPPVYNISQDFGIANTLVLGGGVDNLAPPDSVQLFSSRLYQKPTIWNYAGYSHQDIVGSAENADKVNLPLLAWFNARQQ